MAAIDPANTEPRHFLQGELVEWRLGFDDFPAADWDLKYVFAKSDASHTLTGVAQPEDDFLISITAAQSQQWSPGRYSWQAIVSEKAGLAVHSIGRGITEVIGQFVHETDVRLYYEKLVAELEALLLGRADRADINSAIDGISIAQMDHEQLQAALDTARRRLVSARNREAAALGYPVSSTLQVRMRSRRGGVSLGRRAGETLVR